MGGLKIVGAGVGMGFSLVATAVVLLMVMSSVLAVSDWHGFESSGLERRIVVADAVRPQREAPSPRARAAAPAGVSIVLGAPAGGTAESGPATPAERTAQSSNHAAPAGPRRSDRARRDSERHRPIGDQTPAPPPAPPAPEPAVSPAPAAAPTPVPYRAPDSQVVPATQPVARDDIAPAAPVEAARHPKKKRLAPGRSASGGDDGKRSKSDDSVTAAAAPAVVAVPDVQPEAAASAAPDPPGNGRGRGRDSHPGKGKKKG